MRLARAIGADGLGVLYDFDAIKPRPLTGRLTPFMLGVTQKRYERKLLSERKTKHS